MAKSNPLQEQLLKAGLVKKARAAEVAREQEKARQSRMPSASDESRAAAERARSAKVERDRALEAERKGRQRLTEMAAQAQQIVTDMKVARAGDIEYRFSADGAIRTVLVTDEQRTMLASGVLVIARFGDGYALLPRTAAAKVRERDARMIVLDHGQASSTAATADASEDDAYYAQFKVPDDLAW